MNNNKRGGCGGVSVDGGVNAACDFVQLRVKAWGPIAAAAASSAALQPLQARSVSIHPGQATAFALPLARKSYKHKRWKF